MSKIKNLWEKLKGVKHIQIIIAVVVGLILCVAYFSFCTKPKSDKISDNSTQEYSSTEEYVHALENKLVNVLSKIAGVGETSVVITLECGFTYEYATDTETKTVVSGDTETTIKTETIIMVSNQPVIVKQNYPVIKGVVIVAKGAENFAVKMSIHTAALTVLEVDAENITILA